MSREDLRADLQRAIQQAVARDVDPDAIQAELARWDDRVDAIRYLGGDDDAL